MYLRHDQGDSGFSSRNPMFDESDATLSGLAFDGRFGRDRVPVITYRLSNGQKDDFPASWALPEPDIMRALEYFVEHDGRRSPFVRWHDDAWDHSTEGKGRVHGRSPDRRRDEDRSDPGSPIHHGDLVEAAPKNIIEGVSGNEAKKIKATLEEAGATVEIKCP
jgi:hypothetical protein